MAKTYHVSKRPDGKWQVKGEKAEKASKLFNTKEEALAYYENLKTESHLKFHPSKGKNKGKISKA